MKAPLLLGQVAPQPVLPKAAAGTAPSGPGAQPAKGRRDSDEETECADEEQDGDSEVTPDDHPLCIDPLALVGGLCLACASMDTAFSNPKVRHEFRVFALRTGALSAVCMLVALICLVPLAIPVLFLDVFYNMDTHLWLLGTLCYFLITLPQTQLFVARYFLYRRLDEVFFEALAALDPKWAMNLEAMPPEKRWRTLLRMGQKLLIVMLVLPALLLCARVPYLGGVVMPLFTVWHVRGWIGKKRAIVAALIMLVPQWRYPCTVVLVFYREVMVLGRALLEPYFRRDKEARKDAGKMFGEHEAVILGFCMPLYFVTALPLVGPSLFVIAQSMSPALLVRMAASSKQEEVA
mmetsp:Transcript_54580/g.130209  ORF Transcript_54580/g.130209 Transcript_54580/m.130209 type:complete len:349 (+) Transcript_54580:97-1143(+)